MHYTPLHVSQPPAQVLQAQTPLEYFQYWDKLGNCGMQPKDMGSNDKQSNNGSFIDPSPEFREFTRCIFLTHLRFHLETHLDQNYGHLPEKTVLTQMIYNAGKAGMTLACRRGGYDSASDLIFFADEEGKAVSMNEIAQMIIDSATLNLGTSASLNLGVNVVGYCLRVQKNSEKTSISPESVLSTASFNPKVIRRIFDEVQEK